MSEAWRERGGSFGAKCTGSADALGGGLLGVVDRGFPNFTFRWFCPLASGLFLIQTPAPLLIWLIAQLN